MGDVFWPVLTPDGKWRYAVSIFMHTSVAFVATATTSGLGTGDLFMDVKFPEHRVYGLEERSQFQKQFLYAYWNTGRPEQIFGRVPFGQQLKFKQVFEERILQHARATSPKDRIEFIVPEGVDITTVRGDHFKVSVEEVTKSIATKAGVVIPSRKRLSFNDPQQE